VGYHIPLKAILLDRRVVLNFPAWRDKPLQSFPISNQNMFEWPEVLSAAMHSVRTSMNLHPPASRLYVPRDEQLVMDINTFMDNVGPVYYDTVLRGNLTTVAQLKLMIDRRVGYSGEVPSKSGNNSMYVLLIPLIKIFICIWFSYVGSKSELVTFLKQKDKEFLIKYLRDILPLQQWLVKSKMSHSILTSEDDGLIVVSKIKNFEVTKECYRQLGINESVKTALMDAVAFLFQLRDDRIFDSHQSVNSNRNGYRLWKRSIYLGASFWGVLLEGIKSLDQLKEEYFGPDWNSENYLNVYIYLNSFDGDSVDPWALIQINLVTHTITYFDGRIDGRVEPVPPALNGFLILVKDLLQPLLSALVPDFTNEWHCIVYRETYFEQLDNDFDSGLYITAITYFLSVGVPLFFGRNSIVRLRMNLAYWILVGELPM